jgi:hypothetical protein
LCGFYIKRYFSLSIYQGFSLGTVCALDIPTVNVSNEVLYETDNRYYQTLQTGRRP